MAVRVPWLPQLGLCALKARARRVVLCCMNARLISVGTRPVGVVSFRGSGMTLGGLPSWEILWFGGAKPGRRWAFRCEALAH